MVRVCIKSHAWATQTISDSPIGQHREFEWPICMTFDTYSYTGVQILCQWTQAGRMIESWEVVCRKCRSCRHTKFRIISLHLQTRYVITQKHGGHLIDNDFKSHILTPSTNPQQTPHFPVFGTNHAV